MRGLYANDSEKCVTRLSRDRVHLPKLMNLENNQIKLLKTLGENVSSFIKARQNIPVKISKIYGNLFATSKPPVGNYSEMHVEDFYRMEIKLIGFDCTPRNCTYPSDA